MVSAFAGEAESATTPGVMSAIVVSNASHGRRDMRCSFLTWELSQGKARAATLLPGSAG
ncbi:hypothetical protein HerbRD11066_19730 [Herbidospora sp. RD11066]